MILVNTIQDHLQHKKNLSQLIDDFEETNADGRGRYSLRQGESQSSDFFMPTNVAKQHLDYFTQHVISDTMQQLGKQLGLTSCEYVIHQSWYQRYAKADEHTWHNHPAAHFTNCYFLELPDSSYKTEVLNINGELIEYDAKEGDVITFPAWMKHRSKPNGDGQKTIISFNSSYMYP